MKRQREVVNDHRGCIFGAYPTLRQVNTVYGDDVAQDWLIEQVTQLSAYFGVREKLDDMFLNCAITSTWISAGSKSLT